VYLHVKKHLEMLKHLSPAVITIAALQRGAIIIEGKSEGAAALSKVSDGPEPVAVVGSDPFFEESIELELATPQSQDYVDHNLLLLGYTLRFPPAAR
jgi:hypothetical protein